MSASEARRSAPGETGGSAGRRARRLQTRLSISAALMAGFGLIVALAVALVLLVSVYTFRASTLDLVVDRTELLVESIIARTLQHLEPARNQVELLVARAPLPVEGARRMDEFLRAALEGAPQLATVGFIGLNGRGVAMMRMPDGGLERLSVGDDAAYAGVITGALGRARHETGAFWLAPYFDRRVGRTRMYLAIPVHRDGTFAGIFMASVETGQLSDYLHSVDTGRGEHGFILYGRNAVIAHASFADGVTVSLSTDKPLPELSEIPGEPLGRLWDEGSVAAEYVGPSGMVAQVSAGEGIGPRRAPVVFVYRVLSEFGDPPWLVGAYFEHDTLLASMGQVKFAALVGVAILVLAVLVALAFGRAVTRPIATLTRAAYRLGFEGAGAVEALPRSRFRDIDLAAAAFNEMAGGLRDREFLRETFGKYVPESVASAILRDRGALEPRTREATVLFTDIAGFSAAAESLAPGRLMEVLNEYFSAIIEPVERHGGVIQQFQGDAILATFNMPTDDPDHAANAVRTALGIQTALRGRRFGGRLEMPTRVGVNTGTIVGGIVGAGGRLGYTVHGDAVNMAARLEAMNKEYGTDILVAESTVRAAGEAFRFRLVAEAPVRGVRKTLRVYTPEA